MKASALLRAAVLVALGGSLSACATGAPAAPVLDFARDNCAPVDLARAVSLAPKKERAVHVVTAYLDASSPCAPLEQGDATYALFALPEHLDDKTLTVGSVLEESRILSPAVILLDGDGMPTRRFPSDEFMYRGPLYSVLFRPRSPERYVLVTSDPARIGQVYDSIAIGTNSTSVYSAGATASLTLGTDRPLSRTFSYEGMAQVMINDGNVAR